ncbi:MAG: LytR/AlgR family response regulator transcription factor [Candidatus Aphodosoma sp.]
MRVAIIEDEQPAARLLGSMLKKLRPQWEILQIEGSIEAACAWFELNAHPDLLFLDIQLSDGNSFLFIERTRPSSVIIFTTAYDEYALNAFSVNSIDYLLKPIKIERLGDAIMKYEKLVDSGHRTNVSDIVDALQQVASKEKRYRTRFLISGYQDTVTLNVADVSYFYLQDKITFVVTSDGREFVLDISLDKLMGQLDPDKFFRANRQTILSIGAIAKIEPWFGGKIVITTKPEAQNKIVVSRERVSLFKVWLNY